MLISYPKNFNLLPKSFCFPILEIYLPTQKYKKKIKKYGKAQFKKVETNQLIVHSMQNYEDQIQQM